MTLKSTCSLFAANINHQLRRTALAVLALTFLTAGSSLKAQSCARIDSPTPVYFHKSGGYGSVHVNAPPSCSWLLDFENGSPPLSFAFTSQRWGTGSATVTYYIYPSGTNQIKRGNVHVHGFPYNWQQIRELPY